MGTKTIAIMDDVYETLKALKQPDESFSDELRRMTKQGSIMEFAGALKDFISDEDAKKMKEHIREQRKDRSRLDEIDAKWGRA